jgi:hypothetical protein
MKNKRLGWLILLFLICLFTINFANASMPVYDIISFTPTTIYLSESAKLYAQVSFVQSGVGVQNVNFVWFVNGTEAFSENSTSSTLIYTPQSIGVYLINATVNGYSNGKVITVTVLSQTTPSPTISTNPTPSVPEFSWLTILPLLLTIPIALAMVRKRLQRDES